jgi:hypothetical protein
MAAENGLRENEVVCGLALNIEILAEEQAG